MHPAPSARLTRLLLLAAFALGVVRHAGAQRPTVSPAPSGLDSLVALALRTSPALRAARSRVDAASARVAPAGARPDPMFMAGIQNFPLSDPGFGDFMTMKMIGVSQTIPYPGKLRRRTVIAEREAEAARASADAAERALV
ncbi:MAG: TolC family protein, partial [Gemmatimonadaceae bacterium]|nr:TolC family protein [Gemmatimonadaceae bacterium]